MAALKWSALESNPAVINQIIDNIGIGGVECVDVLFFEDESIRKPQYAVLLCFPEYKRVAEIMKPIYQTATAADDSVFFMKQKIDNACGTFALFHALANLEGTVDIKSGPFLEWLEKAKKVGSGSRSDLLATDKTLEQIHEKAANSGQTAQPEDVQHHFICYVAKNGKLYEIDSRLEFPRMVGESSEETLVKDVGVACQHLFEKLDNVSFSALAIVKK